MRIYVEQTTNGQICRDVKNFSEKDLSLVAYQLIAQKRIQALQRWFYNDKLQQLTTIKQWCEVLPALLLYTNGAVAIKNNELGKLLTIIFRAPTLRSLYQQLLILPNLCYDTERNTRYNLLYMLLDIASRLYGGVNILHTVWKKYSYDKKVIWGDSTQWIHIIPDRNDSTNQVDYAVNIVNYRPLLHTVARFGSKKDLIVYMRLPDLWDEQVFSFLFMNRNKKTVRYVFEWIYTIYQAAASFGDPGKYILENLWLSKIFNENAALQVLYVLNHYVRHQQWKTSMFQWLFVKYCGKKVIPLVYSEKKYNTYNFYTDKKPAHALPEQLIAASNDLPFISPKPDGICIKSLPQTIYPYRVINVQAEQICLGTKTLYLIFDYDTSGRWNDRMYSVAQYHPYWKGPYESLGAENADLVKFIDSTDEVDIWWPKGVYPAPSGADYYALLDKPPVTPYPNDGWILVSNNWFLKIKPQTLLTADIDYRGKKWSTWGSSNVLHDSNITDGVWRCGWNVEQKCWYPITKRTDKIIGNSQVIINQLVTQHEYPWSVGSLYKFDKPVYYTRKNPTPLFKDIQLLKKEWSKKAISTALEIGCGYVKPYAGIDIDPRVVAAHSSTGVKWVDARTMKNPITGQPYEISSWQNYVNCKFSIHYLAESKDSWETFVSTINDCVRLHIMIIDADLLFPNNSMRCEFPDGSFGKKIRKGWTYGVWDAEFCLLWRGNVIHSEPLISYSWLRNMLTQNGWTETFTNILPLGTRHAVFRKNA